MMASEQPGTVPDTDTPAPENGGSPGAPFADERLEPTPDSAGLGSVAAAEALAGATPAGSDQDRR